MAQWWRMSQSLTDLPGAASPDSPPSALDRATVPPGPVREDPATLTNRRGRGLLFGFTAAHFAHHVITSLLNPMLPFIRTDLGLTYAESGFLVSAFSLSLGLSNAPLGILADRIGSRPVISAGLVLIGLASLGLALAGAYWQLVLLLVLTGIIAGTYHAPASALLARAFPARIRGTAMGLHITGGHLSFFITPAVAAALVAATGSWRTPYLWLAVTPIVTAALLWKLAPRGHERPPGGLQRPAVFGEILSVFRVVGPLVSVSLVFQMAYAALMAFTALYMVDARGLPPEYAAAIFGVPQILGVLAAPGAGLLSDRFGRKTVILIGIAGFGPSIYALTIVPNELIVVPLLVLGLFAALRMTTTETFVADNAPPHRRASVLGSYHMLSQELGGLAAPLLGLLAGLVGIGAAYDGVCLALLMLSLAVLLIRNRL